MYLPLGIILLTSVSIFSQTQEWRKFVALESTREDVEKVLGKPEIYFHSFGTYKTQTGTFSVWYSKGGCHKNVEGLQYKIPAQIMIGLRVYMNEALPLENYISDKESYKKSNRRFAMVGLGIVRQMNQ